MSETREQNLADRLTALGWESAYTAREMQFSKPHCSIVEQDGCVSVDFELTDETWSALDAIRAWQSGSPAPRQDGVILTDAMVERGAQVLQQMDRPDCSWSDFGNGNNGARLKWLAAAREIIELALGAKS